MKIAIIGAGFSGIAAAVRLRQAGFDDVVLLERGPDVGGVWRDNTYPGCACDVQSHLYSFSFAPNPTWTRAYSPQPEILAYLRKVADDLGVRPFVRFNHDVKEAAWRDGRWHIEAADLAHGDARVALEADVLIAAQGALSDPVTPSIPGVESFAGKVMHTARWDGSHDLHGRRVAVVGTGASAIQLVPAIQPQVEHLAVFQRTPPWIVPRNDAGISPTWRALYARLPFTQRVVRAAIAQQRELLWHAFVSPRMERVVRGVAKRHLKHAVADAALREKLTPHYRIGCKRILVSDDYYPALQQKNVDVVTAGIARVEPDAVVDSEGKRHTVDTLVFGTGFHVTDPPIAQHVRGRDGRSLAEAWQPSMTAHLGTTVHGFPNLFMLLGPNTGLGHSSVVAMMEIQVAHVVGALSHLRTEGAVSLEPSRAAQDAFVADVDARLARSVWLSGGCASWYLDRSGRSPALWPGTIADFERRAKRFDPDEYVVQR